MGREKTRYMMIAMAVSLAVIFCLTGAKSAEAASKRIKTYYTGDNVQGMGLIGHMTRYRVRSYYLGKTVKYGSRKEVGSVKNTTNKEGSRKVSIKRSTTRSFSMSVTAALPQSVVKSDIKATIGGAVSFDTSITVDATASVEPHSEKSVYVQYKYIYARYKYRVQRQRQKWNGKWINVGKAYTRYNTSTTKVPVLIV